MSGFRDPYVYPGTGVLRNKLDIQDEKRLEEVERHVTTERASAGVPGGKFDLKHLQAIHKHLFQDLYDWAGEVRSVEIAKGGSQFQPTRYIETGMADVHARLKKANFLRNKRPQEFAEKAAEILGDVNYVHPFREGNGRTQLLFLQQLAEQAGYTLDLARIDPAQWLEASRQAHDGQSALMAQTIEPCLQRSFDRGR